MIRYIISRVLILLIPIFFIGWALNALQTDQLYNFFGIEFWSVFKLLFAVAVMIIGAIFLNLVFTLLYFKEFTLQYSIESINGVNLIESGIFRLMVFDPNFSVILFAFLFEKKREKNPSFLLVCVLASLFFEPIVLKGIPFINNYTAIYATLEAEGRNGLPTTTEFPGIVVPNSEANEAEDEMWETMPPPFDDIKTYKYIYIQTALIEGYKSSYHEKGFASYFGCLSYYALEKTIQVLVLFLLPFLIGVVVIEVINEIKGINERKWEIAKDELIRKNSLLKNVLQIIQKYQLDEEPNIHYAVLSYEEALIESWTTIIIGKKSWFDAQTLLCTVDGFFYLDFWTQDALESKTYKIIKSNFHTYHFKYWNNKNALDEAKQIMAKLQTDGCHSGGVQSLLCLIPKNEIEIDVHDFWALESFSRDWRKEF
jgi:hypothetical protein